MAEKRPAFWSDRGLPYFAATAAAAEESLVCLPLSSSVASVV